MSTHKSAQQLVRESVRRILREGVGDKLKSKLFGTSESPTTLRSTVDDNWSGGSYKFVFTPSADKTKLTAAVTAENGADERYVSTIEDAANEAIKSAVPADWADIGPSWTFTYPMGEDTSKSTEINMDVQKESWARLAGLKRVL